MNLEETKQTLQKYAELKSLIKQYGTEVENLAPLVKEAILALNPNDDNKVDTQFGTFSMVQKRKYRYSTDVEVLTDKLKEMKKTEEQTSAEYSVEPYLLFKEKTQ